MNDWIDIPTAAGLLGTTERTIRRRCVSGDLPGAVKRDGAWVIPADADPRFKAGGVVGRRIDQGQFLAIREPKRAGALRKIGIIEVFEKFSAAHVRGGGFRSDAMDAFCVRENIPLPTLKRWLKTYREKGFIGLVDNRGGGLNDSISPDAWEHFKSLYLDARQPSIRQCLRMVTFLSKTEKRGWTIPDYKTLCRYVDKNLPMPVQVLHREGTAAYTEKCAPFIQNDLSDVAPGSCWIGDHHQLNVLIRHKNAWVRPWLTAWEDMRSRAAVGWYLSVSPNQTTILQAFKRGAEIYGLPDSVKIDNGKDYDSELWTGTTKQRRQALKKGYLDKTHLTGLYAMLNIEASFAIAYHPQSKAIERFFDTVDSQFCKFLPTYCGKDTDRKPELLNDFLLSPKAVEAAHTLETLSDLIADYIGVYNRTPHGANDGFAPLAVMESRPSKRTAEPGVLHMLLRVWSRELIVGKNGVRFKGLCYGQFDSILMMHQGRKVRVSYSPDDVSRVFVYDAQSNKLLTIAEQNQLIKYGRGVSEEQLRAAMREKTRAMRACRDYKDAALTKNMDLATLAIKSLADEAPELPPKVTPNIRPVKTPLDGQVETHRKLDRQRAIKQAAGAEGRTPILLDFDFEPEPVFELPKLELSWD